MRVPLHKCALVLASILAVGALAYVLDEGTQASNMGFKMNRVIEPQGVPPTKGQNLVALPYKNPYQDAQDICDALGLANLVAKVRQIDAFGGGTSSHTCGQGGPFVLTGRVGVEIVQQPAQVNGILVGSHVGNPPGTISLAPVVLPPPKGKNQFPVAYHTTSVDAQNVCDDLGIVSNLPNEPAQIKRINAASGATESHTCGQAGPFALVLGESVEVTFFAPPNPSPVNVPAGRPAHF